MNANAFRCMGRLAGVAAVAALVLGCDGGAAVGDGENVCKRCTKGAQVSVSAGSIAPTPCQLSETGVPVDAQTARSLGFGAALDLLASDRESPFQWKAEETSGGSAATGYAPTTTIRVRTAVAGLEHRVPSLAGCQDSVVATLSASLTTGDGALEVEGQVRTTLTHDEQVPTAWGNLDLADARGSLMLYPNGTSAPLAGAVGMGVRFWPEGARGYLSISMSKVQEQGGDVYSFLYQPLGGRWPNDECEFYQRPLAPTDPGATPDGRSTAQLVTDLQGMLDAGPKSGTWDPSGAPASVTTQLGAPTMVCFEATGGRRAVGYRTQLQIKTSDGRVQVKGDARGYASFDASNELISAGVEIYDSKPIRANEFEVKSGIKGVDLGITSAAFWHTEVTVAGGETPGVQGQVVVEGVDLDGNVTGRPWAILGPMATFSWR